MTGRYHGCAATGCGKTIPRHLLMCRAHWSRVPGVVQREVYRTYKNGAGLGTVEYARAVARAVESLDQFTFRDGKMAAAGESDATGEK